MSVKPELKMQFGRDGLSRSVQSKHVALQESDARPPPRAVPHAGLGACLPSPGVGAAGQGMLGTTLLKRRGQGSSGSPRLVGSP